MEQTKKGSVSDGYHTFDELYEHRGLLFIALCNAYPEISWIDGTCYDGYFIAGMHLPTGDITYHLPLEKRHLFNGVNVLYVAPKWDGHSSGDVLKRLHDFCINPLPYDI